jgi:phage N-6-adenine-methyltransferase
MHAALNSSIKMDWQTPDNLLELVRKVGPIALDPCTVVENPTKARFICTPEQDGLKADWSRAGGLVYVNPPYGRSLASWIDKCADESLYLTEIVLLVPARPDTNWFQGGCKQKGSQVPTVLFWKGRLKFKGAKDAAPFPSALFYWGPRHERFREVFAGKGLFL